ncbi:transposase, partial [Butyrivibrio sp. INlla16]
HCRIPVFVELQRKIMRHKDHILNTIELGVTNARIEATNNKIKLLIRKAYGFRDVDSMIDMVLLYCSDLKIPLPNRNRVKYA